MAARRFALVSLLLWATSPAVAQVFEFSASAESVTFDPGTGASDSVEVDLVISDLAGLFTAFPVPVATTGFELDITHDPDLLTVDVVEFVGGFATDFLFIDMDATSPATGNVGVSIGAIYGVFGAPIVTFGLDEGPVVTVTYDPVDTALVDSDEEVVPLVWEELGPAGTLSVIGVPFAVYTPILEDGEVTLTPREFRRGDADSNGELTLLDLALINLFVIGTASLECMDAADADDNGFVEIDDGLYLADFLYAMGPQPPAPGTSTCGSDPTADGLGCAAGGGCP
ncbi:MAG: hypothetical protein AAF581_02090 [Planctomycetota bacterium]